MGDHGNYLTYVQHRCRCDDCRAAWRSYRHDLERRKAKAPISVDRHKVIALVDDLKERWGITPSGLARACGMRQSDRTFYELDTKTRPVPMWIWRRLTALTFEQLPDTVNVWGHLAQTEIDRIMGHGYTRSGAMRAALGWQQPPTKFPGLRAQKRVVMDLRRLADRLDSLCEDCDQPSWGGGRWCWEHFKSRSTPVADNGCGTTAGYAKHRRAGESPCRRCKDAQAAYNRHRSAA